MKDDEEDSLFSMNARNNEPRDSLFSEEGRPDPGQSRLSIEKKKRKLKKNPFLIYGPAIENFFNL